MSANQAFGGPVTYRGRTYPRLTMKHYGELEGALREYRRATLQSALDQQRNLSPQDRAQQIAASEMRPVTWIDVDDWMQTHDGAVRAVRLSLRIDGKTESEADAVLDSMTVLDAVRVARMVMGTLEIVENPPSAA